jgi:hypothetical protein
MKKMKKIEIVENTITDNSVKLTKNEILDILSKEGTYRFICSYEISEDFIIDNYTYFDKEILLLSSINFSEDFIEKGLEIGFLLENDITNLSINIYQNLSNDFLSKYKKYINWSKVILYISTQCDDFEKYTDIISDNNLWSLISSNDLPISFITKWKDKLDWKQLSMVKNFTDDEKELFKDFIWNSEDYKPIDMDIIDFDIDLFEDYMNKNKNN